MRQFDDGNPLRPKEKDERYDPEPNRNAAIGGNRRNNIEVEYRNHEKQNQVASPQGTDEARLSFGLGRRCQVSSEKHRASPDWTAEGGCPHASIGQASEGRTNAPAPRAI